MSILQDGRRLLSFRRDALYGGISDFMMAVLSLPLFMVESAFACGGMMTPAATE
jgi:hypothetical protein